MAGRTFGADAADVLRIGSANPEAVPSKLLGEPRVSTRALVVRFRDTETEVPVDRVIGMKRAKLENLRAMPEFLKGLVPSADVGFLVQDRDLVPLIDLRALVNEEAAS